MKYVVRLDCYIDHSFYEKGDKIEMTKAQAKYEGHKVAPVVDGKKSVTRLNIPAGGRTRLQEMRDKLNAGNEQPDGQES